MGAWGRFRKRVASLIWPEFAKEKEVAASLRIAILENTLLRTFNVIYGFGGKPDEFAEEAGIHWSPEDYEKWICK